MSASKAPSTRSALLSRTALCGVAGGVLLAAANPTAAEDLSGSTTAIGHVSAVGQSGANPTKASITTAGTTFTITPNATRSIIDWDTFKVDTGKNLTFAFAAGGDIAVNRVAGGKAEILGALASKVGAATGGNVWILAPGGVVFGNGSTTTVGGLVASTASLNTADAAFLAGGGTETHSFGGAPDASSVTVVGTAQLSATGHSLALIAPVVTTDAGSTISAPAGTALLAAAQSYKVTFASSASDLDLVSFEVDAATVKGNVSLAGATTAGDVWIAVNPTSVAGSVISLGGLVTATQASGANGDIILSGGGGKIDATGATAATGAATDVTIGTAPVVAGDLTIATLGGVTSTVDLAATGDITTMGATLALKGVTSATATLDATAGAATIGKLKTTGDAEASAVDVLTIASVDVGGALSLKSALDSDKAILIPGAFAVGGLLTVETPVEQVFKGFTDLFGKGTNADIAINLTKNAAKTFGDLDAGTGSISIKTVGDLTTGDLTGKGIAATTQGALEVGKVDGGAGSVTLGSGTTLKAGTVTGVGVTIDAGGAITALGAVDAKTGVAAIATGASFTTGAIKGSGAKLAVTGDLTIDGAQLTTEAGGLTLAVSGATTASTPVTLSVLTGQSGSLDLGDAGNAIGALTNVSTTAGALKVASTTDLVVSGGLAGKTTADVDVGVKTLTVSGPVDSAGGAAFHAGKIDVKSGISSSTAGDIEFDGPLALSADATIAGGGALRFDDVIQGAKALTLSGTSVVLGGAVGGGSKALTSLTVTGATTLNDVTTTAGQSYAAAVLPADVTLTSSGGGDIKFTGAVNTSGATARALTLSTTGLASFGGAVGGAKGLSALSVTAGKASFGATNGAVGALAVKLTAKGDLTYTASGDVTVDAVGGVTGVTTSDGNISLESTGGKLTVASDVKAAAGAGTVSLSADGGALAQTGGAIVADTLSLTGKGGIDVQGAGDAFKTLGQAMNSGKGVIVVADSQGFTVGGKVENTATNGADITLSTTAGDITITQAIAAGGPGVAGDLKIMPAGVLKVGSDLSAGTDLILGDVMLTGDASFTAAHQLTLGALDGGAKATLNNGSVAGALAGAIGATAPLTSLVVNGPAAFSGATVKTTGAQIFNGSLTLGADTALTSTGGGAITVHAVNSDASARTLAFVTNGGAATFLGAVGGTKALQSVTTDGAATFGGGLVNTVGVQTYAGPVTVAADSALKSQGAAITLSGTLDSKDATARNLAIDAGVANVKITGPIGAANAVGLGVRAGSFTGTLTGQHLSTLAVDLSAPLTIANAGPLTIGAISVGGVTVTGVKTDGNAVDLSTTAGDLTLAAGVDAGAATVKLTAAGALLQSGGAINGLSVDAASGAGKALTLGGANTAATVSLSGGAVTYTSAFAGQTDFAKVSSGSASLKTTAGALNFSGNAGATSGLTLDSSAAITQGAGATLTADTLSAKAAGAIALGEANVVREVDLLQAGGDIAFNDVRGAGTTIAGTVDAAGHTFQLTASGPVSGAGGVVKAKVLEATTAGGLDLSGGGNAIAELGVITNTGGGAVKISTTGALASDAAEVLDNAGAAVALNAGSLALAGVIKADTLTGAATGDATFSGPNLVAHIGDFTAGSMSFTSGDAIDVSGRLKVAGALTLDAVNAITEAASPAGVEAGSLTVTKASAVLLGGDNAIGEVTGIAVATGGDVTLATSGGLKLSGLISGAAGSAAGDVVLKSGGAITRTVDGLIYAASFGGSSAGAADLSGPNKVDVLNAFTSGGKFDFGDLNPLTVNGAVKSDGLPATELYLHGDAGLTLTSTVDAGAGTLRIESKDAFIDADKATLTAASLTGFAAKGASFDNAKNSIPVLAGFESNKGGATTDPFALTTSTALDVTAPVTTHGGALALDAKGGDLLLNSDLNAGAGAATLTATGKVEQPQPQAFAVTAATLAVSAVGPVSLLSANQVGDLTSLAGSKIDVLDSAAAVRLGEVLTKGDVNVTADQGSLTLYKGGPGPVIDTLGDVNLIASTVLASDGPSFEIIGDHVKLEAASLDFAGGSATATAGATPAMGVDALILNATTGDLVFGVAKAVGGVVTATTPASLTLGSVIADIANLNAPGGTLSVLAPASIGTTYNAVFYDYATGSAALHPTFLSPAPGTQTFNIDSRNTAGFAYATKIAGPDLLNIKTVGPLSAGDTSAITAITFDVAALPAAPGGATFNGVVETTGGAGATVDIVATGAIAEAGAGAIETATLSAKSVGGMKLDGANVVPTLKSLVNTGSGATIVNDAAGAVTLQTLTAAGEVAIAATVGSLTLALPVSTPAATSFSAITTLKGSDIASAGALKLTALDSMTFTGTVSGSSAAVKATHSASFNTLTTPGELNVDAGGAFTASLAQGGSTTLKTGSVDVQTLNGGATTEADVDGLFHVGDFTTGDATITAGAIDVDTATASGAFTATAGDTAFGSLSAGASVTLKTAALSFDTAASGGAFAATSASIKGGQLTAGGPLTLAATGAIALDTVKASAASTMTGASIAVTGPFTSGGTATFKAAGALTLATAAAGGDLVATAGSFTADTAKAAGSLTATVSGATKANALEATKGDIKLTTGSFAVVAAKAGQDATFTATGAGKLDTLTAARDGVLTAASLALVDSTAGRNLTIKTGPLTAQSLTAKAGNLKVNASTADVKTSAAGGAATLTTTGAATYGDLATGGDATVISGGDLGLTTAEVGGDLIIQSLALTSDTLKVVGKADIAATTASIGALTAGASIAVDTTSDAVIGQLTSGADSTLTIGGGLTLTAADVGNDLVVKAGAFKAETVAVIGDATFTAAGAGQVSTLTAGGNASLTASSLSIGDATAGANLTTSSGPLTATHLTAKTGDLTVSASTADVTSAQAGGSATLTATAAGAYGDLSTGGNATVTSGGGLKLDTAEIGQDLGLQAATTLDVGTVSAVRNLTAVSGPLSAVSLNAKTGDLSVKASTASVTTAHAGAAATLSTTGAATYGDLSTGGDATLTAGGTLGLKTAEIGGNLKATALGITSDALKSSGKATLSATAGDLSLGSLAAGGDATLAATGALGFTSVSSATGAVSSTSTTAAGGTVTAATTLDLLAKGSAGLTRAQSGGALTVSAADLTAGEVAAGGKAKITTTAGDASITTLLAASDLDLAAAGAARVGALASTAPNATLAIKGVDVTLGAATAAAAGAANTLTLDAAAPGALTLTASRDAAVNLTGPARLAAVSAGRTLQASTKGGDLAITTASAGDTLTLGSDASVLARSLTLGASGRSVAVTAGQDVVLGAGAIGTGPAQVTAPAGATLTFVAGRDLLAGLDTGFTATTLSAGRDLNLTSATGDVTVGSATAGRVLGLTAGAGKVAADQVTTTGLFSGAAGSDASIFATSLQVANAITAGSFAATASKGDAAVTRATAGGDLAVTANQGLASLNTATITGGVPGVRTVRVTGASALLGRGAAGAAAGTLTVADAANTVVLVKANAGSATVDLAGDVRLTRVDATGGATVTTGGALTLADTAGSAGGATVGGDATFGAGGALSASNVSAGGNAKLTAASGPLSLSGLNALGDVIGTAGAGPVATSGVVAAGRNLTLAATGETVTIQGSATAGVQALVDAGKTASIDTLRAPTVRVLATDLTLTGGLGQAGATVSVESRNGALTVGDVTTGAGLTLDNAESRRVTADKLDLYAGSTTGAARGDATVGALTLDPGAVKSLSVLAGADHKVTVSGAVTTTTDGAGAFSVGRAPTETGVDPWTPQDVTVTGSIGRATAIGTRSFSNVSAVGAVSLNARDDVLIGTAKFVEAIGANAGSSIDITKGVPTGVTTLPEDSNRIFVAAGTLSLSGAGRIVQQSTGIQQAPVGIYLSNPGKASSALKLTGLGVVQPSVIDLSLSFIDGSGTLLSEQIAASSAAISLAGGLNRSNSYRVNGCAIGASQQCTPTTSTVVDVRPEKLVQSLVLTQAESQVQADPTITGAGNEEIWRNAPTSLSDDSDDRRAKSSGSPPAPAPAPAAAPPPEH